MNKKNKKEQKETEKERERVERERNEEDSKDSEKIACWFQFFGGDRLWLFHAIRSKLLIVNDMC